MEAAAASSSSGLGLPHQYPSERAERVNRTPNEIMQLITPNKDFMINIKPDWRFDSSCKLQLSAGQMKRLYPPYSQKTFSRSWTNVATRHVTWEDALAEVHEFTWRKWKLVSDVSPLTLETGEQRPGDVPKNVLDLLRPKIDNMDPPIHYPKKSK